MSRHARDDSQEGTDEPSQQLMIPAPPSSVGESTIPRNTTTTIIRPPSHDPSSSGGNARSMSRYAAFSTQQDNSVGILRPLSSDEDDDDDDDNVDDERQPYSERVRHWRQTHQQRQQQVGHHHSQISPPRYTASPYAQPPRQLAPAHQSPFSGGPRTELNSPPIPPLSSSINAPLSSTRARTSGHGREYQHNHHHHSRQGRIAAQQQQQQPLRPDQSPPLPLFALPPPPGRLQPTELVQAGNDLEHRRTPPSQPLPSLPSLRQPAAFLALPSLAGRQPLLADPEAPYSIPAPPRNVMAGHGSRTDRRMSGAQFDTRESEGYLAVSGGGGSRESGRSMSYARQEYASSPTAPLPPMAISWQQQQLQQSPLPPRNIPPPAPVTSSTMMVRDRQEDGWTGGSSTISRHDPDGASTVRSRRLVPAPYRGEQSASSPSLAYPGDQDLITTSAPSGWPAMTPSYSSSLPLAYTGALHDDQQRQAHRMAMDPSPSGYYSDQSGETATTSYFRDINRRRALYDDREQQEERMVSSRAGPLLPLIQYDQGSFPSGRIYRDDRVQGQDERGSRSQGAFRTRSSNARNMDVPDIPGLSPYDHQRAPNQRIPAHPEFVQGSSRIDSSAYASTAGRAAPYTHPPPQLPPPRLAAHHDPGSGYHDFMHHHHHQQQQQQHSHPSSGGFPYMNVPYPGSSLDGPPVLSPLPPHPQMMSRQTSAGSSDHGNTRARAKVDVACDICRKSKARCDGARPICGPCTAQKKPCHYQEGPPRRRGPGKNPKGSSKSRQRKQEQQQQQQQEAQQQQQQETISTSGDKNEESSTSKHVGSKTTAILSTTARTAVGGRSGSGSSSTDRDSPAAAHPRAGSLSEGSAEPLLPAHHATPAPFYHHHHHHHRQSHQPHHHHHQAVPVPAPDQGLPAASPAPGSSSVSATTAGASSSAFAMNVDATAATAAAAAYSMFDAAPEVDDDDYAQLLSPLPATMPLGRRRRRGSGTDGEGDGAQSDRSAKLYRNDRTD